MPTSPRWMTRSEQFIANRRRSLLLLVFFAGEVVLAGAVLVAVGLGPVALLVLLFVSLALFVAAYLFAGWVILRLSHARPVGLEEEPRYHNLVEGLCIAAGLPKPGLCVIEDPVPNSFATGRNPQHASVVVTRGLLRVLNRVELEGVLAHELSHIRNNDVLVTSLATLIGLPLLLLTSLSGRALAVAVGRGRECVADETGVRLTRYPPGLAAALEKLAAVPTNDLHSPRATAHLWLASPRNQCNSKSRLKERIAALKEL